MLGDIGNFDAIDFPDAEDVKNLGKKLLKSDAARKLAAKAVTNPGDVLATLQHPDRALKAGIDAFASTYGGDIRKAGTYAADILWDKVIAARIPFGLGPKGASAPAPASAVAETIRPLIDPFMTAFKARIIERADPIKKRVLAMLAAAAAASHGLAFYVGRRSGRTG